MACNTPQPSNSRLTNSFAKDITGEGINPTHVVLRIDGIDYSTKLIMVSIKANNGQNITTIFNPIPLLNPEDDNVGSIEFPIHIQKGLITMGVKYTACIKVIESTNKFGNKISCQKQFLSYNNQQDQLNVKTQNKTPTKNVIPKDKGNTGNVSGGFAIMRLSL
ncbi:MAG: hypothetical protein M3Z01_01165 [Thermoproteota archaeon]|nr:hypothetical protein [Thermoproteota archaeon]